MRPIEIIGGGLAGLSLGIGLRKAGVPTTLLEAGSYPRHKVCGEFISGLADGDADRLALGPHLQDARLLQSVAWFKQGRQVAGFQLPRPALGLSRFALDVRLAEYFEEIGGILQTGRRTQAGDDRPGTVRTSGHRATRSEFIGLKAHFRGLEPKTDLEMHLGHGGYVGLSRVEDDAVNVCGLFRRRSIRAAPTEILERYLRAVGLVDLADQAQKAEIINGSPCAVAGLDYRATPAPGPGLALGDARQLIPPFTGAGMATAFATASEALPPLITYARGELEWEETRETVRNRLSRRLATRMLTARFLHPFLLKPGRQFLVIAMARLNLLPFAVLYRLTHT